MSTIRDFINIVNQLMTETASESAEVITGASREGNILREFAMNPTPKSKRGMFKGVSQADLKKRLTAAKKRMKTHEDKDETHDLRSEVSELEFALRAKHNWGKGD
jgi:hypothetical protein